MVPDDIWPPISGRGSFVRPADPNGADFYIVRARRVAACARAAETARSAGRLAPGPGTDPALSSMSGDRRRRGGSDMNVRLQIAKHPLHPMLTPLPLAAVAFVLVADVAYVFSGSERWFAWSRSMLVAAAVLEL